ncbi:MAG: hypothetical protein KBD40_12215 [Phenylobacterium sp.]|nr:hypothetical protein [Phenylobacterium sp.]
MPDLTLYNQTGRVLTLHLIKAPYAGTDPWTPYDLQLESGKRARIESHEFSRVMVISSGGCDYDYGTRVTELWKTSPAIVVQIEPAFVMHLLSRDFSRPEVGRFRDGEAKGFPVQPVKTCRN